MLQKLSRWGVLESSRQAAAEVERDSPLLSGDQAAAAKRQLFNSKESYSMVLTHPYSSLLIFTHPYSCLLTPGYQTQRKVYMCEHLKFAPGFE